MHDAQPGRRVEVARTYRPQEKVRELVAGEMLVPLHEPAEDTCSQRTSGQLGTKWWCVGGTNHLPALQAKS
jgi:hypothetical protein